MKTLLHLADNELVTMFKAGNQQALEVLVNRHKDRIFSYIRGLVKDTYLAEDLFQEVFIKIIDSLRSNKTYIEEGKFAPWAGRIAHNLCFDHFRKVKRRPTIVTGDDQDIFDVINVVEDSAEKQMIKGQSGDRIRKMVDQLPDEQREVVVLRHYADMSFKEIAEVTNTNMNTALGRMRYALMNLRKMMPEAEMAF